jgi:hypothetical protein
MIYQPVCMMIVLAHDGAENAMRRKPVIELRQLVEMHLMFV